MSYIPTSLYVRTPDGEYWYSDGSCSVHLPRGLNHPGVYSWTPPSCVPNHGSYGSPPPSQSCIRTVADGDSYISYRSNSSSSYPRDTQGSSGINQSFHLTNGPSRSYNSRNGGGTPEVTSRDSNRASSQISYAQQAYQEPIPDATGDIAEFSSRDITLANFSSRCIACGDKGAKKPLPNLGFANWEWTTNGWETFTTSTKDCQRKICTACLEGAGTLLNDARTDLPYVSGLNGRVQAKYRPRPVHQ